jgi:hypothetical protein
MLLNNGKLFSAIGTFFESHQPAYQPIHRICDRNVTSNAIKVFTGDPSHRVCQLLSPIVHVDNTNGAELV